MAPGAADGWPLFCSVLDWPCLEIDQLKRWIAEAVNAMTADTIGKPDVSGKLDLMAWAAGLLAPPGIAEPRG